MIYLHYLLKDNIEPSFKELLFFSTILQLKTFSPMLFTMAERRILTMPATFYMEGGWQDVNDSPKIVMSWLERQILGPDLYLRHQKLWMGLGNLFSTRPPDDSDTRSDNLIV